MERINSLFDELKTLQADKKLPPVEAWSPDRIGEIDIRIDETGRWHHDGRLIERTAISRVFSTILRLDDDEYYLVTPQEKLRIEVEDVPFLGVNLETQGRAEDLQIIVTTNMDDHVVISSENPLQMREEIPYVRIRGGLFARLTRSMFYALVEFGQEEAGRWCVYSAGTRFDLGSV